MVLHQFEADHPTAEELQEGLRLAPLHPCLIAVLVRVAQGEGEVGVVTLQHHGCLHRESVVVLLVLTGHQARAEAEHCLLLLLLWLHLWHGALK